MGSRTLPRLALALTLLAFVIYGVADARPGFVLLAIGMALAGWLISARGGWSGLPQSISWTLVVAAIANAGRTVLADGLDVTDFCEFIILIQLIKLFDRRQTRDVAQLITLDVFLVIGATLLSPALGVGALILAFLPLLVVTAMQYQIYAGQAEAEAWAATRRPGGGGRSRPRAARGRRGGAQLARLTGLVLAGGLAIGVGVFLVMPRGVGREALGQWTQASGAQTGFDDSVELGGDGVISESTRAVLDLEVRDGDGNQLGGPETIHYLRGAVLDQYDDATWQSSPRARTSNVRHATPGRVIPLWRAEGDPPERVQTYRLRDEAEDHATVFSIWRPTSISFGDAGQLGWGPIAGVLSFESDAERIEYTVRSVRQPDREPAPGVGRTPVSFPSEVVRRQAAGVLEEAGLEPDPAERPYAADDRAARAIENHLRRNFAYTLQMLRPPAGTDPIEWFLTERREGHCEYFASAMAAMCRSVGINARMVTGYVAAEFNEASGTYTIRQSNAHAWVEVEAASNLWQTFDPTPPGDLREIHSPDRGLVARAGRWLDAIEYAWIRSVVSYDRSAQIELFGGGRERRAGDADGQAPGRLRGSAWMRALVNGLLAFSGVFVVGLAALWIGRWIGAARAPGPGGMSPEEAAWVRRHAPFYERMLAALREGGAAKPAGDPPELHASRLGADDAELGRLVGGVAALYYRARFGGQPLGPQERASGERLVERVRGRLAGSDGADGGGSDAGVR